MADQFQLPPGATAATLDASQPASGSAAQQFSLPPGATPVDSSAASQTTPGVVSRSLTGVGQGVQEFTAPFTPLDHKEALVHFIGGPGALSIYKAGKAVVSAVENIVKPNAQTPTSTAYQTAVEDFHKTLQHVSNKDYRNAASSAGSTVGDVLSTMPGPGQFFGPQVRDVSEGLRPGADLATPLAKNLTKDVLLGASTLAEAPESATTAALPAESETAATATKVPGAADFTSPSKPTLPQQVSKIEPAVAARTAKAGLAPGEVGLTDAEAVQKTAQSALDARTATQANVDQTLQNIATRHATENGLQAPTSGTASRDVITNNGNALVDAGKANYKILDKFTDGKFTNAQNELKNAQLELQQKAGTTSADTTSLEANVTRAQWNVDKLFDDAVENGMPKETADSARTQFRTGQATLDAGNAVRMANRARGAAGARTTDLNALENRWTALHDSGRLQQAFGEQGAKDALTQVHAARETGELFNSMPPTESQALRDLIAKNTTTGKLGTTTNWGKVRDAFSQMPDRGVRFSDIPKVEKFINNQRFYQQLGRYGAGAIGTVAAGAGTAAGYEAIKAATE